MIATDYGLRLRRRIILYDTTTATLLEQIQEQNQQWKDRVRILQQDARTERYKHRYQCNRQLLEDRARYLALRALRMQTRVQQHIIQANHNATLPKTQWPAPSLSFSATRNYKRKEDTVISQAQLKLEQRLYGKRFKQAWKVYIRLLEALHDIRNHGKQQGAEIVRQVQRQQAGHDHDRQSMGDHTLSSPVSVVHNTTHGTTQTLFMMHQSNHQRMKLLIQLALHGDLYFFFPTSMSVLQDSTSIISRPNVDPATLRHVATEELIQAIKIRGNIERKGALRLSKRREKVLEYFEQSYGRSLFT